MLDKARASDPEGDYRLNDGQSIPIEEVEFDLIFSSFVFIEYESKEIILETFKEFSRLLAPGGIVLIVHPSENNYLNNWLSVLCDFPENHKAKSGNRVQWQIRGF